MVGGLATAHLVPRVGVAQEPTDWSQIDIGCLQRKLCAALLLSVSLLGLLEMAAAHAKEAANARAVELIAGAITVPWHLLHGIFCMASSP